MGSEDGEDQRRHTAVTSQTGCLKARSESRGKHGIALDGEDWYDVWHGLLIITPDGTAKEEEETISTCLWARLHHHLPVLSVFSYVSCHLNFVHIFPDVVDPSPSRLPSSSLPW